MFQLHIFFSTLSVGCRFFFPTHCLEQLQGKSPEQHHHMSMEITDSSMKPIDLRALGRASQSQASQGSNASWVCGFVGLWPWPWPTWNFVGHHGLKTLHLLVIRKWHWSVFVYLFFLKRKTQVTGSLKFTLFHNFPFAKLNGGNDLFSHI